MLFVYSQAQLNDFNDPLKPHVYGEWHNTLFNLFFCGGGKKKKDKKVGEIQDLVLLVRIVRIQWRIQKYVSFSGEELFNYF